ncbi:hypothetical protein F4V43_01625 [Paenibacillus spiritus]|uniref:Uncharacterized protein n=1 Tax=Paenibacillus spiritus TaxID=2496557 RepID=A0A5J5GHL2_9BACL|nr:hypothetical protein [Paenibacillus spiritus]KAA9007212.1 hypothetical protein F4V43_01625 [Paenibacillus spiritus]
MVNNNHDKITKIKGIGPTIINFDTLEDMKNFVECANSKDKTDSEAMNRLRKELAEHKRSLRKSQ